MQLAMIGLGRMGGNMVQRLLHGGHELVVCDRSADAVKELVAKGVTGAKAERALSRDGELASIRGYVEDSGVGRWTVEEVRRACGAHEVTQVRPTVPMRNGTMHATGDHS